MASRSALIALLVVLSCAAAASATSYTVGDTSGWKTGVDYDTWASGKTFAVGDTLVFNFGTGQHDVVEVDKSGYDGCSTSNAVGNAITSGPATVTLSSGTHYYICGFTGHCSGGMKLAVTVGSGSGSGSSPSPSSPSTPSTPSSPPSTTTPSAPAPSSASNTAVPALAMAAGVLLIKLALF